MDKSDLRFFTVFVISFVLLSILAFIGFACTFGIDEGTMPENVFTLTMRWIFAALCFPTHLFDYFNSGDTFVLGIAINIFLYSLIIPHLWRLLNRRI